MKILRIYQCGRQTVRVIHPDGQVRQLHLPAAVADLLRLHPHHCVSHAGGGAILPPEAQLDSGGIYLLSPLPRLFPTSVPALPPLPGTCTCFAQAPVEEEDSRAFVKCGPSIWTGKRHWGFSKISPEGVSLRDAAAAAGGGGKGAGAGAVVKRSRVWEPSLEIIVEDEDGVLVEGQTTASTCVQRTVAKKTAQRRQSCT